MMQTQIRSVAQFLTSSGPMVPCEESDDPTPTVINVFLILGAVLTVSDDPHSTLSKIGLVITLVAVGTKLVVNYLVSTHSTVGGRMRRAVWVLLYHPVLGRPLTVLKMIRESRGLSDRTASVMIAILFFYGCHMISYL